MAAISTTLLRQCPSFRPGVAYVLRNALYLQPCARNVAATSLLASRGPGFALPADCGFERLDPDAEPSAAELAAVVDEVYAASTASSAGAMGESDAGVTFAGDGEPLLALETLISTVELLQVNPNPNPNPDPNPNLNPNPNPNPDPNPNPIQATFCLNQCSGRGACLSGYCRRAPQPQPLT